MRTRTLAALTLFLTAGTSGLAAQDFNWRGSITRGRSIEIRGINGDIIARAASGGEVRVSAEKTARRSNPDDVTVEVVEHSGGVTICAVYPTREGREPNECRPGGGRMSINDNDVRVEFTVEVPAGVKLLAYNVNGSIEATSLAGDAVIETVNGEIDVSTSGIVEATTVNGSIVASLGATAWDGDLSFETVNGDIEVALSGNLNAEVEASTVNGGISTDFPLTVQGRFGPKRLRGTIGNGGRTLVLSTVNGEIELRRR